MAKEYWMRRIHSDTLWAASPLIGLALILAACSASGTQPQPTTVAASTLAPSTVAAAVASAPAKPVAGAVVASSTQPSPVAAASPSPAAAGSGPTLLADDAAAANPELVATQLQVPAGFNQPTQSLRLPAGFSISLLAAGLSGPRFMAFDGAGNLLVAI